MSQYMFSCVFERILRKIAEKWRLLGVRTWVSVATNYALWSTTKGQISEQHVVHLPVSS